MNVACASQSTQWRRDAKSTFTSNPEIQVCYHLFLTESWSSLTNEYMYITYHDALNCCETLISTFIIMVLYTIPAKKEPGNKNKYF